MAVTDTLARDNGALDINTGTLNSPVWTPVGGINSWSPSPTLNRADTTKFSNQGRTSHLPASTSDSFTFGGFRQVDADDGTRDAGQAAVETLSRQLGPDGLGQFRHSRAGGKVSTFMASAVTTDGGGGNDDPDAWSVELQVSGDITNSTPADLPATVTSVAGTGGTGSVSVTWTDGSPAGTLFEVTVFNGSTPVKTVLGSDKPILVSGLASGSRTAKVRAQSAAGWSAQSSASSSFSVS